MKLETKILNFELGRVLPATVDDASLDSPFLFISDLSNTQTQFGANLVPWANDNQNSNTILRAVKAATVFKINVRFVSQQENGMYVVRATTDELTDPLELNLGEAKNIHGTPIRVTGSQVVVARCLAYNEMEQVHGMRYFEKHKGKYHVRYMPLESSDRSPDGTQDDSLWAVTDKILRAGTTEMKRGNTMLCHLQETSKGNYRLVPLIAFDGNNGIRDEHKIPLITQASGFARGSNILNFPVPGRKPISKNNFLRYGFIRNDDQRPPYIEVDVLGVGSDEYFVRRAEIISSKRDRITARRIE